LWSIFISGQADFVGVLAKRADVNLVFNGSETPLSVALAMGHLHVASVLAGSGADVRDRRALHAQQSDRIIVNYTS
jgi:hypothetical protein